MKLRKLTITGALIVVALTGTFWLVANSRAATETPEYKTVKTDDKFEIRDYPALRVARTPMEKNEMNDSFGHLFRYISGRNEGSQKIAMTTPVLIDSNNGKRSMSFIVPKKTVDAGVPKPSGDTVSIATVVSRRVAVYRFAGGRSAENEAAAAGKLKAWMEQQKLTPQGEPIFAYYDPPWTPTFMRRNEVMFSLPAPDSKAEEKK